MDVEQAGDRADELNVFLGAARPEEKHGAVLGHLERDAATASEMRPHLDCPRRGEE